MAPHVFGVPAYLACQGLAGLLAIAITLHLSHAVGLPTRRVLGAVVVLLSAAIVGAVRWLLPPWLLPRIAVRLTVGR
jgi:hypothetical protein